MGIDVPDERAIRQLTQELLKRADAEGRFPTPIDDIVAAAGLVQPKESLFSNSILEQAPSHLRHVIRKLGGRVRAVLDRTTQEVHVDPSIQNEGRVAFYKLHEVSHKIYPWQQELAYADDDATLSPAVRTVFEWEANIGASNLLFQNDAFTDMARQYTIGIASIFDLAIQVGASRHATFRRFARVHDGAVAGVVLDLSPCTREPLTYRRHEMITSDKWAAEFGMSYWPQELRAEPFTFVNSAEEARVSSSVVQREFVFPNLRNEPVTLNVELYSNQYALLVLIWKPRRETFRRRRILVTYGRRRPTGHHFTNNL